MKNMSVELVKITAFVIKDDVENVYTVLMDGDGGPIVSDPDYTKAVEKFSRALNLSCAVSNLKKYQDTVKSDEEEKKRYAKDTVKTTEISYVNIPAHAH